MPFYADLSSLYGTPSSSYSAPYLSGPYSGHSSIIASNFSRPSATFGKSSPRGFTATGRNYKPHLATISESLVPRSIPRINPPSLLLHSSPKFQIQRPISINTADIDVSVNKYRKFERTQKPVLPILKFDRKQAERDMVKPSTDTYTSTADNANDTFMPRIDPDTRNTIKRQRTVVRIHTDHKLPANKQNERAVLSITPKWRENFDPSELTAKEAAKKQPVKTPGAKLVEKFLIKETIKEEDEDRIRSENEEKKRMREEKLKLYDEGKKRRSVKRKQSVKKSPSFHDICKTISSDKINEDLNPVHTILEQRRQSKIFSDEEVLKEIRRNSAEILQEQVLLLDEMIRQQNETEMRLKPEESSQKQIKDKDEDETDEEKKNQDYSSRGSIKRKKKITKKKSNEKIILPPDDEEEVKSSLQRRPVHKKTRRSSTASSLDSVTEDSHYDKETEQAYQDAIRDISQGEVEKIEVKNKSRSNEAEQKQPLKDLVEQIQIEESPKTRKYAKKTQDNVAKNTPENDDVAILKRNLQNMLLESDKSQTLKTDVENIGVVLKAKPKGIITFNVMQKQPVVGRKGQILNEKCVPAKKETNLSSTVTSNHEVNNNEINVNCVLLNKHQVNKLNTETNDFPFTHDSECTLDDKPKDLVFVKDKDSKLSRKSEVLENLAKAEDQDKKPTLLSKSKSIKDLEFRKLNELKDDKQLSELQTNENVQLAGDAKKTKKITDEQEISLNAALKRSTESPAKISKQDKKFEPVTSTKNTASPDIIESREMFKIGTQEMKNAEKNKTVLTSIKAPDAEDTINQTKQQNSEKIKIPWKKQSTDSKQNIVDTKFASKIEPKAPERQLNKQMNFSIKKKTDKAVDDGEFDFWSSIDPEANIIKTRELIKAEQEKWQTLKWEQESQRLEEQEKAKEEEKIKQKLAEEEAEKRKQKQAEEERKRKQKLADEEEKRKQKLAEEEEKRKKKLAEEEEKRKQKLAEEEDKRKQKLAEEEQKRRQKLKEEAELKRKQTEEDAQRVKLAQEEEKKKQKLKEEELKRRRAELEEQTKRLAAEAQRRQQKLADEEQKRQGKLAEEERKRKEKLAEEEQKRKEKLAEEEHKRKGKLAEEEQKRKQRQKEEADKKQKEKLAQEEKLKRKQVQEELKRQRALDEYRKRKQAEEEEEANRKRLAAEEEEQFRKDAEVEAERVKVEEHKRMVSKRSIVTKYNTVQDPDLEVFDVPEEPAPEPEPEEEQPEASGGFVPLQSNRISQFMIPFQKPEHYDECPVVIMATPKDIRKRHYPKPRVAHLPTPTPPPPPPPAVTEEDEEDEDDEDTEEDSEEESSDEESSSKEEEYAVERPGADIGKSTSSTDSGFDSSAPGSPANRRHNG